MVRANHSRWPGLSRLWWICELAKRRRARHALASHGDFLVTESVDNLVTEDGDFLIT